MAAEEAELEENPQDIFYLASKTLTSLKEKLEKNTEVTKEDFEKVLNYDSLDDEEEMLPVDMKALEEEFDDVEEMIEKLGPKGTAEAFVKAEKFFEANKDKWPEEDRPKPMTGKEWKEVLQDDDEGEEEEFLEDEEELLVEGEEEEDGEEDAAEPPEKKAKTV